MQADFGGRGVLLLRDPYSAVLSDHNFLYAGHHGRAPKENFKRKGSFDAVAHVSIGKKCSILQDSQCFAELVPCMYLFKGIYAEIS